MPKQPNLTEIPVEHWDKTLSPVIDDMRGQPLNVHKLLANHPDLLKAWWSLRMHVVAGGTLEQREAELVILRTAVHTAQWYEWASHVVRGQAAGLSLQEIERIADGPDAEGWSTQDAILLAAVDELDAARALSDRTQAALSQYFSAQQVLDVIAIYSTYVMLGVILNSWNVELDDEVAGALPVKATRHRFELMLAD